MRCRSASPPLDLVPSQLSSSQQSMSQPSRAEIWGGSILRGRASQPRQANLPGSRSIDTINRILNSRVA